MNWKLSKPDILNSVKPTLDPTPYNASPTPLASTGVPPQRSGSSSRETRKTRLAPPHPVFRKIP
ncbi:hypothetical protein NIES4103_56840 [Nostoc sp. NIES-4103]|nr:hypothetical protein NIES4103_56840 [Nostoc sp. NIES-4103]